jgi:hypothetical protein
MRASGEFHKLPTSARKIVVPKRVHLQVDRS